MEETKPVNIYVSDFNTMTHIAQIQGLLYPKGHRFAGKMNAAETLHHIIGRLV